jgi:hypothetical protein
MKNDGTEKADVLQGTLILLVLRTLEALGPLHGYGIARRIEQISKDVLQLNQGTLYPALLRMEQEGWISSKWGPRRRAVGRNSTPLPLPGGDDSPRKLKIGGAWRQRLNVSLALIRGAWRRSADELGHRGCRSAAWAV